MDIGRGNEASKSSKTGIEESDESGISKHSSREPDATHSRERSSGISDSSKKHQELGVETGRSKPLEAYPGRGIETNHSRFNSDAFDGTESSKVVSSERLRLSSSSSSSSSSSGSSTDNRFQANTKLPESRSGIVSTSSSKPDAEHHVLGSATSKSEAPSLVHDPTLTQSPPVQVMDRIGEYDPYRIPSSVFERSNSLTPADWSATSNDSLFSIQVEDHSFSREHGLNLKSGELFKSGDLFALNQSPVPSAIDPDKKSIESDKRDSNFISDDTLKDKSTGPGAEEPIGEKPTHPMRFWNSPTPSNHSDDTGTSVHSFAFPVFEDSRNVVVPKEEKREQQQRKEQEQEQEEPLAPAEPSNSSCCTNSCSWFSCCRQRWRCCDWDWNWNWNWNWNCSWNWRCSGSRCCRGKCH